MSPIDDEELREELALLRDDLEELERIDRDTERVELIAGITMSIVLLLLACSPLIVALLGWELHRSRQRPRESAPIRHAEGRLDALDAFRR